MWDCGATWLSDVCKYKYLISYINAYYPQMKMSWLFCYFILFVFNVSHHAIRSQHVKKWSADSSLPSSPSPLLARALPRVLRERESREPGREGQMESTQVCVNTAEVRRCTSERAALLTAATLCLHRSNVLGKTWGTDGSWPSRQRGGACSHCTNTDCEGAKLVLRCLFRFFVLYKIKQFKGSGEKKKIDEQDSSFKSV